MRQAGERRVDAGCGRCGGCGGGAEARCEQVQGDAAHRETGAGEELAAGEVVEVGVDGVHRREAGGEDLSGMTGRFAPREWLDCFGAALLAMTGLRSLGVEGGSETLPYS